MGAKEAISRKVFYSIIAEIKVGLENAQFKEEQSKNFTAKKEKKTNWAKCLLEKTSNMELKYNDNSFLNLTFHLILLYLFVLFCSFGSFRSK